MTLSQQHDGSVSHPSSCEVYESINTLLFFVSHVPIQLGVVWIIIDHVFFFLGNIIDHVAAKWIRFGVVRRTMLSLIGLYDWLWFAIVAAASKWEFGRMKLTPREVEKLMLHDAGYLAQKRLARGLRLNYTEAVALLATQVLKIYLGATTILHALVTLVIYLHSL